MHCATCVTPPSQEGLKILLCDGGGDRFDKLHPGGSCCLVLSHDQATAATARTTQVDLLAVLPPVRIHEKLNSDSRCRHQLKEK